MLQRRDEMASREFKYPLKYTAMMVNDGNGYTSSPLAKEEIVDDGMVEKIAFCSISAIPKLDCIEVVSLHRCGVFSREIVI